MSRHTGHRYSQDAKEIIFRVDKCCKLVKEAGLQNFLKQSAECSVTLTGTSKTTIRGIVEEVEAPSNRETPDNDTVAKKRLDDFGQGVIWHTIQQMYTKQKVLPTVKNVLSTLKESIGFTGSREHLRKNLIRMRFTYRKCPSNSFNGEIEYLLPEDTIF